ncbi:uncharacterized protein LOC113502928 [Trichoplusia ni]|uniref:Uncharacterized protein LOC113502925 isoform X1 n=1 Tax=Trichoplusia ni TaxID=7111 RepID=A0A7E5WK24_TRINI|nr:uncharacterized protein LOC113502925 isoform X1 [Trichoplusia ni]XP_026740483.1 uncharacterized protein LOC113502928 [Trichoplusia ni]
MVTMSFADKVVLVTGGSSGIGAAAAVLFAKEGAAVAVVGRNRAKLDSVAQRCRELGARTLLITADIANDQEASTIVQKTIDEFGKLDVLINNAGITHLAGLQSTNIMESYDMVMNTNLRATVYITSLAVPHLISTKGNIINISSTLGKASNKRMLAYCVSKAGLDHFSKVIALELASSGVRVNTVRLGPVITDILENAGLPFTWDDLAKETPLGKVATADEAADMILFLASDKAKSVTGGEFTIDNGILIK